jgi:hypothetical protein
MNPTHLFPPSTNADYQGAKISAWFLVLSALLTIAPGIIHYFLPDGGAGVIGGLDLSTRADTIIAIFAWYGAMQIPFGILLLVVGLRYRTLTPLCLLLVTVQQGLGAFSGWFWKGAGSGHHPPEHYVSVASVVLGLLFLVLSLRSSTRTVHA